MIISALLVDNTRQTEYNHYALYKEHNDYGGDYMKFCAKCGNEIADEAVGCVNCGFSTGVLKSDAVTKKTKKAIGKKKIVLLIIAAVLVAALLVGAYFLANYIHTLSIVEDLSGRSFTYFDEQSYPALGLYDYTRKKLAFDHNGELTYSYYFSNIDAGGEYKQEYQIKFENDMIILVAGIYEYEIQYDKYDRIEGIYNYVFDELYE